MPLCLCGHRALLYIFSRRECANTHRRQRREGPLEHRSKGGPLVKIDEKHVRMLSAATQLEYDMLHTEISGSAVDSATFTYARVVTPEDEQSVSADVDRL